MPFEQIAEVINSESNRLALLPNSSELQNDSLVKVRALGLKRFIANGLPTVKNEEWKYTNLIPVLSAFGTQHVDADAISKHSHGYEELAAALGAGVTTVHIALPGSNITLSGELPKGVEFSELTSTNIVDNQQIQALLLHTAEDTHHPFNALHSAIIQTGVVLTIKKETVVEQPIHIAFTINANNNQVVTSPRLIVVAEENAQATIIESCHVLGNQPVLNVPVCDIVAEANSTIHLVKINDNAPQLRLVSITSATVNRDASAYVHTLCMGAKFNRNDVKINLLEPSAQGFLYGVSVTDNEELVDNHTVVDHQVPHCHSEELYKGVYNGSSRGVFNGKIFVREQAQKTTAYQSCHSLLLSSNAQVQAKPQLEIWADDVKCSHGATMGQLDPDALFYLQARGISLEDAKALLTYAFVAEVAEHLPTEQLRSYAAARISAVLGTTPFQL